MCLQEKARLQQTVKDQADELRLLSEERKHLLGKTISAQEEERRNISRELHDEVGQSLSALLMEAGNAAAHVAPEDAHVRQHVDSIKKLAEAAGVDVNKARDLLAEYLPIVIDKATPEGKLPPKNKA